MATPSRAPNSTKTLSGTFGGVEPPCCADFPACNHTLEPLRSQGPMPATCRGTKNKTSRGQTYGGDRVR